MRTQQELQRELKAKEAEVNNMLVGALRNMNQMNDKADNVNTQLYRQNEALNRMNDKLDATDKELKQSKKLLSSIGSFWGFLKNRITGWKYQETKVESKIPTDTEVKKEHVQMPSSGSNDVVDELIESTNRLKAKARVTNEVLSNQAPKIEEISKKVDKNIHNIGLLNKETKRILN